MSSPPVYPLTVPLHPGTVPAGFPFLRPTASGTGLGEIDGYHVLRVLGTGGMGVVFLAREVQLDREVALKVIHPHAALDEQTRRFFLREGRVMAALEHENVVPVYRVGEANGVLFLTMPVLRGCSLEAWLGAVPDRPLGDVLRLGREIATGLAAAHAKGLVHRDIKPANVWLEVPPADAAGPSAGPLPDGSRLPDGFRRVKILDFGLARPIESDQQLTAREFVVGTPGYLAPELVRGDPPTPACDLFSLGVVLYQCLSGEVPFRGRTALATLFTTAAKPPAPLRPRALGVPEPVTQFVMQLLSRDPALRPASARAVAERLAELERDPHHGPAPAGRRRAAWLLAATAAPLVAGLVCAYRPWATADVPLTPEPVLTANDQREPLAPLASFAGLGEEPVGAVFLDGGSRVLALTADGWLHEWPVAEPGAGRQRWRAHPARGYALTASPDGRVLLTGGNDERGRSQVVGWEPGTGRPLFRVPGGVTWTDVISVSRDGTRAGATGAGRWSLTFDTRTGHPLEPSAGPEWISSVALSPDGTRAVTGSQWEPFARVWDVSNGVALVTLGPFDGNGTRGAAFAPDGRTVALGCSDGTVRLWDADTELPGPVLTGHAHAPHVLAFSPDGRWLASGCLGGVVRLWDVSTGAAAGVRVAHGGTVAALAFAPDGSRLLSAGEGRSVRLWAVPDGSTAR